MLQLDEQALADHFWETELSYVANDGETVILDDSQKLIQNQPMEQIDETRPWVRFTISPGMSRPDQTGDNPTHLQLGIAYLQVFAPKGTGMSQAKGIRDKFLGSFRNFRSPDHRLHVYRTGVDTIDDKAYTQIKVSVFWESLRKPG